MYFSCKSILNLGQFLDLRQELLVVVASFLLRVDVGF
jgi:hypothetical protein